MYNYVQMDEINNQEYKNYGKLCIRYYDQAIYKYPAYRAVYHHNNILASLFKEGDVSRDCLFALNHVNDHPDV